MLGCKSVEPLYTFLQGFAYARRGTEEGVDDYRVLADFTKWVRKRYRITSTQSWAQIITFFATDHSNSFELFFRLYDDFRQQKSPFPEHGDSERQWDSGRDANDS